LSAPGCPVFARDYLTMHRFFVPADCLGTEVTALPAATAQQITRVLRLRPGARVLLFCGDGAQTEAVLEEAGPRGVTARLVERTAPDVELPAPLHVAVAILKGEKLDWLVQKLTEIGVARISLVRTERTVPIAGEERWPRRVERFRRVVQEAAEQSGRVQLPAIEEPVPFAELLRAEHPGARLILDPLAERGLAAAVPAGAPVLLLIGPEGGFSAAEVEAARRAGFTGVRLGRRVLRAETAAIAAAAIAAARLEAGE
jgi:16S rRNA (uracil1498-N3)-methyltransferase